MTYRVVYVSASVATGVRHVWHPGNYSLDEAAKLVRKYKRAGRTAWVATPDGTHVPIPGASRLPESMRRRAVED